MREIVLDTETTGFEPTEGHRIVEIGAIELENHLPTGRVYHQYLDPQRPMPPEALEVHGLGDEFLRGKPVFRDVAQAFLDFIGEAKMVIHNASFDMKFLNAELRAAGKTALPDARAVDTLLIARQKYPGAPASLDALCRRFGVDNSNRIKHGALLDCELLAEVYLELIGGRQPGLLLSEGPHQANTDKTLQTSGPTVRPAPLSSLLTEKEAEAHRAMIAKMGPSAVWAKRM